MSSLIRKVKPNQTNAGGGGLNLMRSYSMTLTAIFHSEDRMKDVRMRQIQLLLIRNVHKINIKENFDLPEYNKKIYVHLNRFLLY